ncbi:MAG: peptidylprolyl isomerase [Anaerolineae bacterium]|nr:peptidylprolyl isomerase [Anaerolineae bacterium]
MTDKPLTVADDLVVRLDYTLRLEGDPEVFDTSAGQEPLEFIQGRGHIIPGLERALYGMAVGQKKEVVIQPEDGYGELDPDAFERIPRDAFPSTMDLEVGLGLELQDDDGEILEAYVSELHPDSVMLDFNHPLAGETLYFEVEVMGLRPATAEELEHDHVHD